jgi:phage terminase large subunit-like protein
MQNPFNIETHPYCHKGHEYSNDIISGKVKANQYVVGACLRYQRDLIRIEEDSKCPFWFNEDKAERFLRIVQKFHHPVGHWDTPNIVYLPWQCFIWMNIKGFYSHKTKHVRFRTAHVDVARGNGKANRLCLEVPTPNGIRLLGELTVGDQVYDRYGNVCEIIGETPIHYPDAYEITFDKNKKVVASADHLWFVDDKNGRERLSYNKRKNNHMPDVEKILKTSEMVDSVKVRKGKESNYGVKKSKPIDGKSENLIVNPYYLGYWIGNGNKRDGRVSCDIKDAIELVSILKQKGISSSKIKSANGNGCVFTAYGQLVKLREIGVLNDKHIPTNYLTANYEDRLELARGLLDSDGSIATYSNKGNIEFSTVKKELADDFSYLISSLGFKNGIVKARINSNFHSDNEFYYRVSFTPRVDVDFFHLKRKKDRQVRTKSGFTQQDYFYITDIKPHKKVPMKCIMVDSPDNSYLITRDCIPTHNSAMASQAALFDLCCDNPVSNRIYCAATSRDQAKEVLEGSRIMAKKNEKFLKRFGVDVRAHEVKHEKSNSFINAISAQAQSLDGKIGLLVVTDELHAMQRKTFEVLDSGMSKRRDSLLLSITTAGYANDGVGYSQRKYAQKVALGELDDETFFSMVFCLEDDDDKYEPSNWIKANPCYGHSVDPDNFAAKAKKAKANPEDSANFFIKHCNMYLDSLHQFFNPKKWMELRNTSLKMEDFAGYPCYVGIDLASKIDITSVCYVFRKDNHYYPFWKSFIPDARIKNIKNRNYLAYVEEGDLISTPGEVVNIPKIEEMLIEDSKKYKFNSVFFDPWNAVEMSTRLLQEGLNMVEFRMNVANFSEPTKKLQALIIGNNISHNSGEMIKWSLGNVVCKYDAADNVFPRKEHESLKIDPIIAAIMGVAGWISEQGDTESIYEERGIISF